MTMQELEILIAQTREKIYRTAMDNNLTDAEYNYFIHSVLYDISIGLSKSAYKALKKEMNISEISLNGTAGEVIPNGMDN